MVSPHKKTPRKGTPKRIKAEGTEAVSEDKIISFDLRKVKLEPDINRGLNPSKTNLPSDQIKDALIQNASETNVESSSIQREASISDNLMLMSKKVIVKKERIDEESYSETNEEFAKYSSVKVKLEKHVNESENLELMSNNIIVKKEHIDDDDHDLENNEELFENSAVEVNVEEQVINGSNALRIDEENYSETNEEFAKCSSVEGKLEEHVNESENLMLMSNNIIVKKEHIDDYEDDLENNEVIFENSVVEVNVKEQVNGSNNITVKKEHIDDDGYSENHFDESVDIEEQEESDSSGDDVLIDSVEASEENISYPVIVEKGSICDTNSVNISVDPASECLVDKIVGIVTVTQETICNSNMQESCIDSSDILQDGNNTMTQFRDESKSILTDEDFEMAPVSLHKDLEYDSSKMDVSAEDSEVTGLTMPAAEKNEINASSSFETKLENVAFIEVPVRTSNLIETCPDEEIMFENVNEEVNDETNELEANTEIKFENNIPCVNVFSSDTVNNHCGEILNNVLSSVDAMADIIASQVPNDVSSTVTIGTEHSNLNINADAGSLLNNQQKKQNKCIPSGLKSKQRSKKHSNPFVAKNLRNASEDDVSDRKRVLMKRKYSSLDWCKSLTKKYKVKHIPMQKHIQNFKLHKIDRDVANTLESVIISSVASCESPTSLRKSMSNSVVERSKNNVQEFDASTIVQELSETGVGAKELSTKRYPFGKILSEEQSILNESRSCPSTPVHFAGGHIRRSNSVSDHSKNYNKSTLSVFKPKKDDGLIDISSIKTEDQTSTYEMDNIQNRKRKLSDPHDLSSSVIKNNFVSKLKELDGGSPAGEKRLRQLIIGFSPKKSPRKFSPKKSPMKFSPKKSPHKYFDYMQRKQKYVSLSRQKRKSLLSKTGVNLTKILREKLIPDTSSDKVQTAIALSSDESDSDVLELYVDPKRYADKECMIIYESPDVVVIDSD